MGQVHVVVLEERHPALEFRVAGELVDALEDFLAGVVGRVRLAGEDDLHRAPRIHQQPPEPLEVAEDQVSPLVGREPAGEADGERRRVQQGARADHLSRLLHLGGKPAAGLLPDEVRQDLLEPDVGLPQALVVQRQHLVPESGLVQARAPVRSQVLVEQAHDRTRHPRGQVHAVGHVADGHRLPRASGPEIAPDVPRDLPMAPRYPVHAGGQPHGGDGHVELARQLRVRA
jgi:hypothetical protein